MLEKILADKLAGIAVKQIKAGMEYSKKRKKRIRKYETLYINNNDPKALPGRFDVSMPIIGGFVDTLRSKLNDPMTLIFEKTDEADYSKAMKVTAMFNRDSSPQRGKWRIKDLRGKYLAAFSGVAIFNIFSESDPKYKNTFRNVIHHNFYCQPKKGPDLEEHKYLGEINVWRSKSTLKKGSLSGKYDAQQVNQLFSQTSDPNFKLNDEIIINDRDHYRALGLDDSQNYTGDQEFCMVNHFMEHEGERYYLFIDYNTGTWIRAELLEDLPFGKPEDSDVVLWPFSSWHTHEDPSEFWSKSPCDDVYPVSEVMRAIINLALENLRKRTRTKRAVDPSIFPDINEIEDDATEVIETKALIENKNIGQGVYEFKTEDNTNITVNLVNWMNSFLGEKTGITPGSQGNAAEDKATIYVGNIQQVADRMGLTSDYYRQCWSEVGLRWLLGLIENLTEGYFVKILGLQGYEWKEITKSEVKPMRDFDIRIVSSNDDSELNASKNKRKFEALQSAILGFKDKMNPEWALEQTLRAGGWEDEEIKAAQDTDVYGGRKILAEAATAIEMILVGKKDPKVNRRANDAFVMKIIDFADDESDSLSKDQYERLYAYAYLHLDIVARNTARRILLLRRMAGEKALMEGDQGMPQQTPQGAPQPQETPGMMNGQRPGVQPTNMNEITVP